MTEHTFLMKREPRPSGGRNIGTHAARAVCTSAWIVIAAGSAVLIVRAQVPEWIPPRPVTWLGAKGSESTILFMYAAVGVAFTAYMLTGRGRARHAAVIAVAWIAGIAGVLGFFSMVGCSAQPADFFSSVWSTMRLFAGNLTGTQRYGVSCSQTLPSSMEVARLLALTATILGAATITVAVTSLQNRWDRLMVRLSYRVICVVGLDADTLPLVLSLAGRATWRRALIVMAEDPSAEPVQQAWLAGARVLPYGARGPSEHRFWRKLEELLLLSSDPHINVRHLDELAANIDPAVWRLPVTVRVDDPWLSHSLRGQYMERPKGAWAIDIVGSYDDTAQNFVADIVRSRDSPSVYVVGDSPLAVALCGALARHHRATEFLHGTPIAPPRLVLFGGSAEAVVADWTRMSAGSERDGYVAVDVRAACPPPGGVITQLCADDAAGRIDAIVIAEDPPSALEPGRLALHLPTVPIYHLNHRRDLPEIICGIDPLRTATLAVSTTEPRWESAARLIHERYRARFRPPPDKPTSRPWESLDPFYKQSNRRQVLNVLWLVESLGTHRWTAVAGEELPADFDTLAPLDQLAWLGFTRSQATFLARREHEDWVRFYRAAGWRTGTPSKTARKQSRLNPRLVSWEGLADIDGAYERAYGGLADTLFQLRELGYFLARADVPAASGRGPDETRPPSRSPGV